MNKKLTVLYIVIATVIISSCSSTSPAKPTWWKYQGNIRNWGQAQADVINGKLKFPPLHSAGSQVGGPVLWSDNNYKEFNDAKVVAGFGNLGLTAFVPLNGNEVNHYAPGGSITPCPAIPVNGEGPKAIFGSTVDGFAFCITDGFQPKWLHKFVEQGEVLVSAPTIWDNIVFVTAGKTFFALDANTGNELWYEIINKDNSNSHYINSAVVDPDIVSSVYVADDQRRVWKFSVSVNKQPVWTTTPLPGNITGHLMIDGHRNIYVPLDDGSIRILEPVNGQEIGRFESHEMGLTFGTTLSHDGKTFYLINSQGTLFAVDVETRKTIWFHKTGLPPTTPIVVTPNGTLWFGVGNGFTNAALLSYKGSEAPVFPPIRGFSGVVNHIAGGPDGSLYVAAGNNLYFIK